MLGRAGDELPDANFIDVIQLLPGWAPEHQVQHLAQVAHVDATLAHHLGQRGPIHGQHRVVCTVLHQAGDLAGEQKGSGIFQQLLLVPNFLLAGLGEANPWREDVRVEADVEGRAADGAHCLARIADHLSAPRVCCPIIRSDGLRQLLHLSQATGTAALFLASRLGCWRVFRLGL